MKKILGVALSLAVGASLAQAQIVPGKAVCAPKIDPRTTKLGFTIRHGGTCAADDQYLHVSSGPQGALILTPGSPPAPAAEEEELAKFKKFFQGEPSQKEP